MMIVYKRRAAALAFLKYLHPQPSTISCHANVAAVLVYDVRHAVERAGVHTLFNVSFVVATAKKLYNVLVLN